jgi:hypothetical protein
LPSMFMNPSGRPVRISASKTLVIVLSLPCIWRKDTPIGVRN